MPIGPLAKRSSKKSGRSTGAQPIQRIGKILVIFRQSPEPEERRPEINARRNVRRRR